MAKKDYDFVLASMTPQYLISLSVLMFTFSSTNGSLSAPRSIDCQSKPVLMETAILESYLADQHTVAVIDSYSEIPIVSPNCLRTPIKLHAFTLNRFQGFVEEAYEQNTKQLDYRTNECFVGAGHVEQLAEELIPFVARYNPRAKVMLITQHTSGEQLAELFHIAWYRYRLLQLVVLNHHENDTMESCVFNPFHKQTSLSMWPPETLPSDLECRLLAGVNESLMSYGADMTRFTHERVRNLHGYPLKIAMHSSNGSTSAYDCILGPVTFTDIDQEILSIMQSMLNFSMILHNDELELSIGYIHPNGTPVGTLGLIENNLVDLAANSRIIHNYDTRNLLYLHYITTEKLVFITPRNFYRNRDITLVFINPFSVAYMLTNVLLSFGAPLTIYLLERVAHRLPVPVNTRQQSFGTKVLNTVGIIYNVSVRLPRSARKRWIIVGILVYNIVSYPIWQGVTIRYLQPSNEQVNNINSLEELIDTDLTLKVSQYHEHIVRHEGPHQQNPVYRELTGRLNTKNTSSLRRSIEKIIIDRDTALLISDVYVPLVLAGNYEWIPGKPDAIWSIGKPIYEFYKSMAVPKTSPFVQPLNSIVLACVEAGFNERFMHQLETVVQLMKIRRIKEHPGKPNYIVFNMEHLMPLFVFYFAMMALACVIFLLEIVVWRITDARRHRVIPAPVNDFVPFEFVL